MKRTNSDNETEESSQGAFVTISPAMLQVEETQDSDRAIICRVVSGAKDEFRILVDRYQEQVYRMLLRQTGDGSVSRDLCQETFLAAYRALGGFRGESQFSTWLTRIALNISKNYFRSKQYRERRKQFELKHEDTAEVFESGEIEEQLFLLREFIGDLPPLYREVIVLCGLERKSYEEASEILEVPVGTIRSRLNTARLKLRERFLGKEGR